MGDLRKGDPGPRVHFRITRNHLHSIAGSAPSLQILGPDPILSPFLASFACLSAMSLPFTSKPGSESVFLLVCDLIFIQCVGWVRSLQMDLAHSIGARAAPDTLLRSDTAFL